VHNPTPNRLITEKSPYLLQHAHNPVFWYPWCDEAFELAMAEDKPVFLSVGYSACHWCHVMAKESFEDEEVAKILNRSFVAIKVDREERPDIDSIYMEACRIMTGGGGWPLSVFLTPDQKPFYAGTYYPKRSASGRPGFIELLEVIEREWRFNRKAILKNADILLKELRKEEKGSPLYPFTDVINTHLTYLRHTFDPDYGGFGGAPKFPMPSSLLFLAELCKKKKDAKSANMLFTSLDSMYRGGINDHIGGGFARYSTDRIWLVPHFEKMLYDNAQLIKVYAEAYGISGKSIYFDAVSDTINYLKSEMRGAEGGFYSAQDADSEGAEGLYYLFTPQEITSVLGEAEGRRFCEAYGITAEGNFEGKNIPNLIGKESIMPSDFKGAKEKLYSFRRGRMSIKTDDKYLSFWNCLLAESLAAAYKITKNAGHLALAKGALGFVKKHLTDGKLVYTSYKDGVRGKVSVLDDIASYISACLALYGVTFDEGYLKEAKDYCGNAIKEFWDGEKGGFFLTPVSGEKLITRRKEVYDGVTPSGNSLMYCNILYLLQAGAFDSGLYEIKDKLGKFMEKSGSAAAQGYFAYAKLKEEHFTKLVCVLPGDTDRQSFIDDHKEALLKYDFVAIERPSETYSLSGGLATFYVCENGVCKDPTNILPIIDATQ
jgi:uncharacterized protein YyaL (SSP411 family)